MTVRILVLALAVLTAAATPRGQAAALPDPEPFLAAVRENLLRAQEEQVHFGYKERSQELRTNPFGRLGGGPLLVYEYTPTDDPRVFNRRLLERDGKPVANSQPEQIRRRSRTTARASFEDVVAMLSFAIDRREPLDGRPAIVVKFKPQANGKPKTRQGRIARVLSGDIWIDEEAHEVVKVEARTVEDITFGYGLIARLDEGTLVTMHRRPAGGAVWLPVSAGFKGEGRALLLRKVNLDYRVDWFDYKDYMN